MVVLKSETLWGCNDKMRVDHRMRIELYKASNDFRCNPMIYKFYDLQLLVLDPLQWADPRAWRAYKWLTT